jgi:hypothetical protein
VASYYEGLRVIDVSNPSDPAEVSSLDLGRGTDVAAKGNYALMTVFEGLRVVDAPIPEFPRHVASFPTSNRAERITLDGDRAFIADRGGVLVLDVSRPEIPLPEGFIPTNGSARHVSVDGDRVFVADFQEGLRVIDASDLSNPLELGYFDTVSDCEALTVSGGYAFVGDAVVGLRVIDLTNPLRPVELGSIAMPDEVMEIAVAGERAFVADWGGGLRIIDVSDPRTPIERAVYEDPAGIIGVTVAGDYAYAAACSSGVRILDISVPDNPVPVGHFDTSGCALSLALRDSLLYVGLNSMLKIVDVSDPSAPAGLGSTSITGSPRKIDVRGDHVYLANFTEGLEIVNVADPGSPFTVGSYRPLGRPRFWDIAERDGYVYVADGGGLRVIYVADVTNPVEVGFYGVNWLSVGVDVDDDYVYMVEGTWGDPVDGGLYVLAFDPPPVPVFINSFVARDEGASIKLTWDVVADEIVAGFRIYRSEGGGVPVALPESGVMLSAKTRTFDDRNVRAGLWYHYALNVVLADGSETRSQTVEVRTGASTLTLHQNHPNPFNPETVIAFALSERSHVTLTIYDAQGKLVNILVNGVEAPGLREVSWGGFDRRGNPVSSGVYFYRLHAGSERLTKKMVLLR